MYQGISEHTLQFAQMHLSQSPLFHPCTWLALIRWLAQCWEATAALAGRCAFSRMKRTSSGTGLPFVKSTWRSSVHRVQHLLPSRTEYPSQALQRGSTRSRTAASRLPLQARSLDAIIKRWTTVRQTRSDRMKMERYCTPHLGQPHPVSYDG